MWRALAGGGEEHLRRGDRLPARRVVLAAPELVEAELVEVGGRARGRAGTSASGTRRTGGAARGTLRSASWSSPDDTAPRRGTPRSRAGRRWRRRDSNPQPPPCKGGALPIAPRPRGAVRRHRRHGSGEVGPPTGSADCDARPAAGLATASPAASVVLGATAFGVTFIFGSYSATSTTRPRARTPPAGRRGTSSTARRTARRRRGRSGGSSDGAAYRRSRRCRTPRPASAGSGPPSRSARTRRPGTPAATGVARRRPGPSTARPAAGGEAGADQPPAVTGAAAGGRVEQLDGQLAAADQPAAERRPARVVAVHLDVAAVVARPPHARVVVEVVAPSGSSGPVVGRGRRARRRGCRSRRRARRAPQHVGVRRPAVAVGAERRRARRGRRRRARRRGR